MTAVLIVVAMIIVFFAGAYAAVSTMPTPKPYRGILHMLDRKVNLCDFYSEISRHADTCKQQIGVDEVSRVMATCFDVLATKSAEEVLHLVGHGIEVAHARQDTVNL